MNSAFAAALRGAALALSTVALAACVPSASAGLPTPVAPNLPLAPQQLATLAAGAIMSSTAPNALASPGPATATPVPPPATPVPTVPPAPTVVPSTPTPVPGNASGGADCRTLTHVVQRGENLFRIALRYGTTTAAVARQNRIANTAVVYAGQRLTITACGADSGDRTYVVQSGDTLYRIAARFGVTVQAIQLANRLTTSGIVTGQVLTIP